MSWADARNLIPSSPLHVFEITVFVSGAPTSAPIASTSTVNVLKSSYWAFTVLAVIPILCVAFACYAGYRCRKMPKRYIMERSDDPEGADYMYPPI